MNKLLKSVRSPSSRKNDILKQSITKNLSNVIKEIQYASVEENKNSKILGITEATNELSTVLESMFLHGLRDSMSYKFKKALSGIDEKPQAPDFWAPILVISHKEIINQITKLSQINTEIGQCRAWIRLALNDSLLSSYLLIIRQDSSAIKSYYNAYAYLRDNDLLEVAQKLIEGVENIKIFTMPTNSSLLNNWQMQSLVLAGIWSSTLKNSPLAYCDDIASALEDDAKLTLQEQESETASVSSAISYGSQNSSLRQALALSEDEMLNIILSKDKVRNDNNTEAPCSSSSDRLDYDVDNFPHNCTTGNSLNNKQGWSFDGKIQEINSVNQLTSLENINKPMEGTFTSLVESYNMIGGNYIRTPDIREMWQKFEEKSTPPDTPQPEELEPDEPRIESSITTAALTTSLPDQVFKIAIEKGLDVQNFECSDCRIPLENRFYNLCYYTGDYFCDKCISIQEISIPARIIHNWDFKLYSVSTKSFNYLNEIKDHPVIDFKVVNPKIYKISEEMNELQLLRTQLNFLRAYLYTCRKPVIEQLQKQMWPREYMYEHIHQYSISDLNEIKHSILAQQLQRVVKFGKEHVANCWLCSQKGFVCEICNNSKALFPFDVEHVYRCDNCNGVYHKNCFNATKPCRKCDRRKKREELSLIGALTVSLS